VVRWPFRSQQTAEIVVPTVLTTKPVTETQLNAVELLELLRWHIDRYDRLRASTSVRASILLSASSVLLTGMILLANYRLQMQVAHPISGVDIALAAALLTTTTLSFSSITNCVNAIAARKTTRSLHAGEIPDRFLFNWGDTTRTVDGYTSFAERVASLDVTTILGHATAEIWTDILQHARRHKYLRHGITLFRYGVLAFLVFAALTLWVVSS
jgi:hypothetical protein